METVNNINIAISNAVDGRSDLVFSFSGCGYEHIVKVNDVDTTHQMGTMFAQAWEAFKELE